MFCLFCFVFKNTVFWIKKEPEIKKPNNQAVEDKQLFYRVDYKGGQRKKLYSVRQLSRTEWHH